MQCCRRAKRREAQGRAGTICRYVSISEDSSTIVRLVHSTVYVRCVTPASESMESTASGLNVRYRMTGVW